MAAIDISKLVQESIANIASSSSGSIEPTNNINIDMLNSKMVEKLEESSKTKTFVKRGLGAIGAAGAAGYTAKKAYDNYKSTSAVKNGAKLAGADNTSVAKKVTSGAKLGGTDSISIAKNVEAAKFVPVNSAKTSSAMDKLRSAGSHVKDTAKEAYSQFSHSPKAQMVAGGTAAALGAGLAAKRYLQRKKK